jgi:hypothetical protein
MKLHHVFIGLFFIAAAFLFINRRKLRKEDKNAIREEIRSNTEKEIPVNRDLRTRHFERVRTDISIEDVNPIDTTREEIRNARR